MLSYFKPTERRAELDLQRGKLITSASSQNGEVTREEIKQLTRKLVGEGEVRRGQGKVKKKASSEDSSSVLEAKPKGGI